MPLTLKDKQKSLKRRFLLILGIIVMICCIALGIIVMFWDGIATQYPPYQKKIFGGMILVYAVLRFSRLLKKDADE